MTLDKPERSFKTSEGSLNLKRIPGCVNVVVRLLKDVR
jgi:hypothetical protein